MVPAEYFHGIVPCVTHFSGLSIVEQWKIKLLNMNKTFLITI